MVTSPALLGLRTGHSMCLDSDEAVDADVLTPDPIFRIEVKVNGQENMHGIGTNWSVLPRFRDISY